MSVFWDNLNNLCKDRGIYPNTVTAALGLSVATASKWKNGAQPRDVTLQKVADYFNVTVADLTEEKKPERSEQLKKFMQMFYSLSTEQQKQFLDEIRKDAE
jgi:transcriptional regulator with XRE-family HTH domain